MKKEIPVLYADKKDCCGCGACRNACPKAAITMEEDPCGFLYPRIDEAVCVACGRCTKVCAYQHRTEAHTPLKTWVAAAKDEEQLRNAASGGAFSALAERLVSAGGAAAGAAMDSTFHVAHLLAENSEDLKQLRGSKYTHSSTGTVFRDVKAALKSGKKVLFSGTPCQVAALSAYLGEEYENLITADLICHGVPSNRMFRDYLSHLEEKTGKKVTAFSFRDKRLGWGIKGSAETEDGKRIKILPSASSYVYYFSRGLIYRENCYSCKYACAHRPGDITLGDYWGLEKVHPELLAQGHIKESKGVSVIIANTQKGVRFIEENADLFTCFESTFEKAAKHNTQLNRPVQMDDRRAELLRLYQEQGWKAVDERFCKNMGLRRYSDHVKLLLPAGVKRFLKKIR